MMRLVLTMLIFLLVGAGMNGPLWLGFALHAAFYAAILWLLILGPFILRRFVRVKRGLCPACAYPMGGSTICTECGRELSARRITS